jgi:hypothetical protein
VRRDLPRPGPDWYEHVLLNLHLRLPGLSAAARQELRAARADFEARARTRLTDAELAARMFLARPVPEGWHSPDLARDLIELFARKRLPDDPAFPESVAACLTVAEASVGSSSPDGEAYREEQINVLRLIRAEVAGRPAG